MSNTTLFRAVHVSTTAAVFLLALTSPANRAAADVVIMEDGRQFEGKIIEKDAFNLKLDAMVSGIRTNLALRLAEVRSIQEQPLADGFFDSEDAIAESLADAAGPSVDQSLFIVVPIKGKFGEQVVAEGVRQSLIHAVRNRIGNVVFEVDSDGGDVDTAEEVYRLLEMYDKRLSYHTIVQRCLRGALVFPAWSDSVQMRPGAVIGGGDGFDLADLPQVDRVMLSQIAFEVGLVAEAHGKRADVARAMIDPGVELCAWRDEAGALMFGASLPENVPDERVIFIDDDQSVVTLTTQDAIGLGLVAEYTGSADELGQRLHIDGWTRESDAGQTAMNQAVKLQINRAANEAARAETLIKQNITRREVVQRNIDANLERAAEWDPRGGSYSTYQTTSDSYTRVGRRRYHYTDSKDTNRLTSESRTVWRNRTDLTLSALRQARTSIREMRRLDTQAENLGLETNYAEGELDLLQQDVEAAIMLLVAHRNRKST